MNKDKEVLKYNLETGIFDVINDSLMPYQLKGSIRQGKDRIAFIQNYQRCNFKIEVDRNDFLTESHYKSFIRKLKEIK